MVMVMFLAPLNVNSVISTKKKKGKLSYSYRAFLFLFKYV